MPHTKLPQLARTLLPALCLAMLCTPAGADRIYKWTDKDGTVQYTQMPPPEDVQAIEIQDPAPPPADPAGESAQVQEQVDAMEERMKAREEAAAKAEQKAENREIRRQNCATARHNLGELQQGGGRRYRAADGSVLRLTEEERQQRIAEANQQIEEFCQD